MARKLWTSFAPAGSTFGRPASKRAFTPYNPTVPSGSYDPSLDAALGATQRGLQDTEADYSTQAQRGLTDYGLGRDQILQAQARGNADLDTRLSRSGEDYNRNIEMLTRNYQNLATSQQEQQNAAGVLDGGAVLQAQAKRQQNMAIEGEPINTAWQREYANVGQARSRLGEDTSSQLGQLGLGYQRSSDDALSTLTRARREAGQFGIDTNTQKLFQASQAGYVAPPRPSNEFTSAGGTPYKVIKTATGHIYVDQYGRRLGGRPA